MLKKFKYMFIGFDRIHERDGRMDRRRDERTPHDGIGSACATELCMHLI